MPPIRLAVASATLAILFITSTSGHGFCTIPRVRGSLNSRNNIPNPVLDKEAPIDYCPHCNNMGGVGSVAAGGPYKTFAPFEYMRGGMTMCGDATGNNDHTRKGKFANPPSMLFVADFKANSVENFEYDFTTNHNGYLEFFLCDVSQTGDVVDSVDFFKQSCKYLERSPHPACEDGTDMDCGPIDPKFPGRWTVPCNRQSGGSDQIFGGPNGKMAYKIPDVNFPDAVIISYWLTSNSCQTSDGFMQGYNYPKAWGKCPGDGGSTGGRPQDSMLDCVTAKRTPEEFLGCADVRVLGGAGGGGVAPAPPHKTEAPKLISPAPPTVFGGANGGGGVPAPPPKAADPKPRSPAPQPKALASKSSAPTPKRRMRRRAAPAPRRRAKSKGRAWRPRTPYGTSKSNARAPEWRAQRRRVRKPAPKKAGGRHPGSGRPEPESNEQEQQRLNRERQRQESGERRRKQEHDRRMREHNSRIN